MAYIDNLTVKGGAVVLRTNDDIATGGYNGFENGDGSKQTMIKNSILVEGGSLYIGKNNGQSSTAYNSHYLNAIGTSSKAATITQKAGYIEINGKTRVKDGLSITQTGGQMVFANEAAGRAMIVFNGSTANTINQGGDENTKMTLGQLGVLSGSFVSGKYVTSGAGNGQVNIEQTGQGEIHLAKGVTYKTNNASTASTITQSGGGKINLSGNFSSAIFNINQSKGTINLNSGASMVSNVLDANTAATLNISGTLTINTDLAFNIDTPDQTTAAIVMAGGDINVQNIANAVEFNLSDAVITDMMTDAMAYTRETGEELFTYTIDLVSGLNDTDKGEFEALMTSGKLEWSLELPTVYRGPITMTELVDSGLQWSGDTLQIQTTWKSTPEPTTATLSLLALTGLAIRRRRK